MTRLVGWGVRIAAVLGFMSPMGGFAASYQVGGCQSGVQNFTTISAAVAGIPPGSTIAVCPGIYAEQVTISQPLTLMGVSAGNANRAVIAIPPHGYPNGVFTTLIPNVTSMFGVPLYAQVVVQNVNPPGPVNITGLTVDGAGNDLLDPFGGCSASLVGVFYAPSTTGTVNELTARNQVGCGAAIWVENGVGAGQSITIENSSVHNYGAFGIYAESNQNSATLTVTIEQNFVAAADPLWVGYQEGIFLNSWNPNSGVTPVTRATGTIAGNVVSAGPQGEAIDSFDPIAITSNWVVNHAGGIIASSGSTVTGNTLSNIGMIHEGWALGFRSSDGITAESNTIRYAFGAIGAIGVSGGTFKNNVVNDAGFVGTCTGAVFYNADHICP